MVSSSLNHLAGLDSYTFGISFLTLTLAGLFICKMKSEIKHVEGNTGVSTMGGLIASPLLYWGGLA